MSGMRGKDITSDGESAWSNCVFSIPGKGEYGVLVSDLLLVEGCVCFVRGLW
jgi:hypothetical protein